MFNTNSLNALLGRNIGVDLSKELLTKGYNVGKLKLLSDAELTALGLSDEIIDVLRNEARPPIPVDTVIKLLYESKNVCCVCRDPLKGIIIHHIDEWHNSSSHEESNLVVLCLHHHDLAHTRKHLSLALSPTRLIGFKKKWLEDVKFQDSKTILGLIGEWSRWDYVNINRSFELFLNLNIKPYNFGTYSTLKHYNIIEENGLIKPVAEWNLVQQPRRYFTDIGPSQIQLTYYLKEIVESIVRKIPIIDITNQLNKNYIKALVKPGVFISAQLGFYFREEEPYQDYGSQRKTAYYRGNKIKISFSFDAWECTSSSGRFDHMTSKKIITPILYVKSVIEENGWLNISTSCIAAGSYFDEHRNPTF